MWAIALIERDLLRACVSTNFILLSLRFVTFQHSFDPFLFNAIGLWLLLAIRLKEMNSVNLLMYSTQTYTLCVQWFFQYGYCKLTRLFFYDILYFNLKIVFVRTEKLTNTCNQHEKLSFNREYSHGVFGFNSIRWIGIILHLHCAQVHSFFELFVFFLFVLSPLFPSVNELVPYDCKNRCYTTCLSVRSVFLCCFSIRVYNLFKSFSFWLFQLASIPSNVLCEKKEKKNVLNSSDLIINGLTLI